jgi:UDP-N-acetylmuramoyl-tripeptide--D-alanyl-D-alanine ligase
MTPLSAAAFAQVAGGQLVAGDPARPCSRFSFDSRTLVPGEAFLAIPGPGRDGHAFLAHALQRGAGALVISHLAAAAALSPSDTPVVLVPDTVAALQRAARHVRRASAATVVAITGSAGKTTTKEAAATLLSARFRTIRNRGNFNNHIGLPISLMDLQDGAEVAVVEFGMNHAGEIRQLVEIAEPDVRVWTNVGTAHIEFFGTQDAIAAAKAEILEAATPATVVVANADDRRVVEHVAGFRGTAIMFGVEAKADVRAVRIEDRGLAGQRVEVQAPGGRVALELALPGRANLENVLAAVSVAVALGVPLAHVAERAATICPAAHRGEVQRLGRDVVVFDDSYNASPTALRRTLELIGADRTGRRRVAFLGEMLELGAASEPLHRGCGQAVAEAGVSTLVTVGGRPARALGEAAVESGLAHGAVSHVETSEEAASLVPSVVRDGDLVLVKGSRGTRMERVVDRLRVEFA